MNVITQTFTSTSLLNYTLYKHYVYLNIKLQKEYWYHDPT